MKKYLLISVYLCLFISCYKPPYPDCPIKTRSGYDNRLRIINNSTDSVVLTYQFSYPDTTLYEINEPRYFDPNYLIAGNEDKTLRRSGCWEDVFLRNEAGVVQIFLFDMRVLRSVDWSVIQSEKRYLKRFLFTLEEIKAQNWQLVYTP